MTEEETPPTTTSEISGIQSHTNFQAIDATFYNLTTTDGRSVASLLVLLDGMHRPVRAELHLYEDLDGFTRDNTTRQAQLLLQERYYSREPVTLRVMYVALDRNSYNVPLPAPESAPSDQGQSSINWTMIIGVVVALLLVVAVIWLGVRLLGSGDSGETVAATETVIAGETEDSATVDEAAVTDDAGSSTGAFESQDLPQSQNARDDLAVGMRVIIQPGFQSNILDQPNVTDGASIGTFQDGEGAQLLDGPVLRQGASDTIVWWYALTDGGIEGWVPANTSQLTLLIPAEAEE